LLSRDAGI